MVASAIPSTVAALQQRHAEPRYGPRPLPLFLDMLQRVTAGDPTRRLAALAGLRAFQDAPRGRPPRRRPARFRKGHARLLDYGDQSDPAAGPPIIVIPSLINPPTILDLPSASLLGWLASCGPTWLLDWGTPSPADRDLDITGHVERRLLPLIDRMPEPPVLVGYCLGGTIALAAAAARPVAGVATIAAPWHFSGYGAATRSDIAAFWAQVQPACAALGLVPVEVLQSGFWQLDPDRTIAKYEAFGRLPSDSAAGRDFVALEDWANGGAPLTYAAGAELFEDLIARDLTGTGSWSVAGRIVDPGAIAAPVIEFVSLTDRIAPAATRAGIGTRHDLTAGHVGMVVGRAARAALWEPLADWLRTIARAAEAGSRSRGE